MQKLDYSRIAKVYGLDKKMQASWVDVYRGPLQESAWLINARSSCAFKINVTLKVGAMDSWHNALMLRANCVTRRTCLRDPTLEL